jgi:RND superfamily putative drug exporter
MDRLAGILERRRWLVLVAWLLTLLAALPFAAKQTDHLTSGGFEVPGSQSQVVSENVTRFEGAQRDSLAAVLARRPDADAAAVRAEVDRVGRIADSLPHVELRPAVNWWLPKRVDRVLPHAGFESSRQPALDLGG